MAPHVRRQQALAFLRAQPGVLRARVMFPGEKDSELASFYLLDVDHAGAKSLLRSLRSDSRVVHVELAARRKALR